MKNGKTMEKDDVCINCSFLCRLKTGLAVSGFGVMDAVWGIPSPSFPPSLQSHPAGSSSSLGFPLLPKDRAGIWALRGHCGYQALAPLLVWMSHYIQRIKVTGGLVALFSMTIYGIALHNSLNDSISLKFRPWISPSSSKPQKWICLQCWVTMSA